MTPNTATQLVGVLVTTTTGWNDDSVDATIAMMVNRWPDEHCARNAISQVVETWTAQSRPPWAVLAAAYRDAQRRQAMNRDQLPASTGRVVTLTEGRQIGAAAYARACRERDPDIDIHILSKFRSTEPNPKILDSLLGLIGHE
jgi:hypothetical protein